MKHHLHTENLLLRPLTLDDAPDVFAFANDYDVLKMTATWVWPLTGEEVMRRLEEMLAFDPANDFTIAIEYQGTVIGTAGLHRQQKTSAYIGYMLGQSYWGKGFASEIILPICAYGFQEMGLDVITGEVAVDNPASMRVLEKNGFMQVAGTEMNPCKARGEDIECAIFALHKKNV